jgi:hypothetical protein
VGLSIKDTGEASPSGRHFTVNQRLYKTADGRIVAADDPDANSLFKRAGQSIPMREAIECGLVSSEEADSVQEKPAKTKQAAKPKDKLAPKAKNKGKGK